MVLTIDVAAAISKEGIKFKPKIGSDKLGGEVEVEFGGAKWKGDPHSYEYTWEAVAIGESQGKTPANKKGGTQE